MIEETEKKRTLIFSYLDCVAVWIKLPKCAPQFENVLPRKALLLQASTRIYRTIGKPCREVTARKNHPKVMSPSHENLWIDSRKEHKLVLP